MKKMSIPLLAALLSGCVVYAPESPTHRDQYPIPKGHMPPLVNAGFGIRTAHLGSSLHPAIAGITASRSSRRLSDQRVTRAETDTPKEKPV